MLKQLFKYNLPANKRQLASWLHNNIDAVLGRDKTDPYTYIPGEDFHGLWNAFNLREHEAITYKFFKSQKFLRQIDVLGTRDQRIKLILEFNDKLEKCYNDHRNVLVTEHTQPSLYMQPIEVELSDNLVVLSGLTKMAEILANQSNTYFNFLEIGTDATPVDFLNTHLKAPHYRVNVLDIGWFEPHGNHLMTGTIFPQDMPNLTIREMGAFDQPVGGAMWWRIAIIEVQKQLEHRVDETYATLSHSHHLKGK